MFGLFGLWCPSLCSRSTVSWSRSSTHHCHLLFISSKTLCIRGPKNKMIEGKLISKIDSSLNSYMLCSTFIETDSRSNQSTIAANSLYQFINTEQELGVLIGSNEGRSLVLVFTNLEKSDFYQNIAAVYLFSMHIPIETCCQNIAEVMKIHGSNVSSLILIELNQRYFISCLEAGSNIHVLHLKEDQYVIR